VTGRAEAVDVHASARRLGAMIGRVNDAQNVVALQALERDVEKELAGDEALPSVLGMIHAKKLRLAGVLERA
jgi:hypothetical protein